MIARIATRLCAASLAPAARGWLGASMALSLFARVTVTWGALSAAREGMSQAMASAVLFGVLLSASSFTRLVAASGVRLSLLSVVSRGLLAAPNDPRTSIDGARVTAGLFATEHLVLLAAPSVVVDALAIVVTAALAASALPSRTLLVGAAALGLAAALSLAIRGVAGRAADAAWKAFAPVGRDVEAALAGRAELVASDRAPHLLARSAKHAADYVRTSRASDVLASLAGRIPTVAAALSVAAAVALASGDGRAPISVIADAVVVASLLPALAGIAQAWMDVVRDAPMVGELAARVLDVAPPPDRVAARRVELRAVSFRYPGATVDAIEQVTLSVEPGRVLALAGPNGSGKSTILSLLAGLVVPTSGMLSIDGAVVDPARVAPRVFFVRSPAFVEEDATVRAAFALFGIDDEAACRAALLAVGLDARLHGDLDVPVSSLSDGQRQRLSLARVLASDAAIVLLDEPEANLDAGGVDVLRSLLDTLKGRGAAVVVAAHAPEVLALACSRHDLAPR